MLLPQIITNLTKGCLSKTCPSFVVILVRVLFRPKYCLSATSNLLGDGNRAPSSTIYHRLDVRTLADAPKEALQQETLAPTARLWTGKTNLRPVAAKKSHYKAVRTPNWNFKSN